MNRLRERLTFLHESRTHFRTIGAIAPSGRWLARALAAPLRVHQDPLRILEVGPGTGAVTAEVVKQLRPGDWLDLVEVNDGFVEILKERFAREAPFQSVAEQCAVHHLSLLQFEPQGQYDFVICGLPFNNFRPEEVQDLLDRCVQWLIPGGRLMFFEYMFLRTVRRWLSTRASRMRMRQIEQIMQGKFRDMLVRRDWVFLNLPPAWVHHLLKGKPVAQEVRRASLRLATEPVC
jgi:phospholipid N-methyltransferase